MLAVPGVMETGWRRCLEAGGAAPPRRPRRARPERGAGLPVGGEPTYNADRGPVNVFALRTRIAFSGRVRTCRGGPTPRGAAQRAGRAPPSDRGASRDQRLRGAGGLLGPLPGIDPAALPADALWIDLLDPTAEKEAAAERLLGVGVPTRQEMAEIEESARLYEERGALVMTAVVVTGVSERRRPATAEVTFVLTPTTLATVRYADPLPFRTFAAKCRRDPCTARGFWDAKLKPTRPAPRVEAARHGWRRAA